MAKRVVVTIDPRTSTISYEVNGIIGTSCEEITALLRVGQEVEDEKYTEEYSLEVEKQDYLFQEDES